jgi:hypothetical protein
MLSFRFAKKAFPVVILILSLTVSATAQSNVELKKQANSRNIEAQARVAFVTEYIRELSAIENIRASADQVLSQSTNDEKLSNAIYSSKRMQFELGLQINILKRMHMDPPFETLIPNIIKFNERKVELLQRLIDISSTFISGPKPGVDYGKLAAEMPQIRAAKDYIDQSLFESTPLIFSTLIDLKADSQNHVSRLIITRAEREKLLDDITTDFGSKLNQKDPNFQVGAVVILKEGLLKDFKSSDDPWE